MLNDLRSATLPSPIRWRQGLALLFSVLAASAGGCGSAPDFEPLIQAENTRQVDAPALTEALSASDPQLRARAAVAYGRIAQAPGIAPLRSLLADGEAQVREAAAFGLGQFGWFDSIKGHETELNDALKALLSDGDPSVRSQAIAAIGKLGDPGTATQLATPLLQDREPQVRAEAALAMHRARQVARARDAMATVPPLTDAALAGLVALGKDSDVSVRRAAIYFFSRNKDVRGMALAAQLMRDADSWVRMFAVLTLKRIGDTGAVAMVIGALSDADYTVRVAAVQTLDALQKADKLPPQLLSDPAFHVRAAVADAYGNSTLPDQPLEQLWTSDASITVRAQALLALAKRRQAAAAPLLTMAMADRNPQIRAAAVGSAALVGVASPDGGALLQRGLADSMEQVRVAALEQLGDASEGWVFEAIRVALKAPGLAERGTAASLLAARQESDRMELAWQSYQESGGHRWRDIRQMLVDVFDSDPGQTGTDRLRAAAKDPERVVAEYARDRLVARGIKDAPEPPAEIFVYSPYQDLRFARNPVVAIGTTRGTFEVELFAADAPIHVASFIGLVREGAYLGLPWHRVVSNFVVQGGDPDGSGWGDGGFSLRAEINEHRFERGALGMPRGADFDSGGAQMFFNHIPTPHLDGQYTVFGQIRSGIEVVDAIEQGDRIVSAHVLQ